MQKKKLVRITTVPLSLDKLLSGQLHYMNSYYKVIAVSAEKEYLEAVGKKENIATFHLEMTRKITPIKDLIAVFKLYLFLRRERPFIVHSHTPKAGIVAMLAAYLAGVPNRLHTIAGMPLLETTGLKRSVLRFVEKFTYSCATKLFPNSFGLETIILNNKFCKPEKLKVLAKGSSNGIDTSYFSSEFFTPKENKLLREQLNISESDFVFVFVGRLVKDKGINEMIVAFQQLQEINTEIKLLLVGDYESELDPLLSETLSIITNNQAVIPVGFKSDVRPYFAIANVLVFPSYREGFPNVVLQAGAMGLPSIVSDINGCNEIIKEGENGLIIPVKNIKAIFDAMLSFLSNIDLMNRCKSNARPMIVSRYQRDKVWDAIHEEYQKLEDNKLYD